MIYEEKESTPITNQEEEGEKTTEEETTEEETEKTEEVE